MRAAETRTNFSVEGYRRTHQGLWWEHRASALPAHSRNLFSPCSRLASRNSWLTGAQPPSFGVHALRQGRERGRGVPFPPAPTLEPGGVRSNRESYGREDAFLHPACCLSSVELLATGAWGGQPAWMPLQEGIGQTDGWRESPSQSTSSDGQLQSPCFRSKLSLNAQVHRRSNLIVFGGCLRIRWEHCEMQEAG